MTRATVGIAALLAVTACGPADDRYDEDEPYFRTMPTDTLPRDTLRDTMLGDTIMARDTARRDTVRDPLRRR